MRQGILAGGTWIRDRVKAIDAFPREEMLANILSESSSNGGAPYNLLLNLAKLDSAISLSAVGRIGMDEDGDAILEDGKKFDIDCRQLRRTAAVSTSYTDVFTVRDSGKRTFFHHRGANAQLVAEDFDFQISDAKHFHLGYLLLLDGLDQSDPDFGTGSARVLAQARAAGMTTSFDLVSEDSDRFVDLVAPALSHADIVFMNEFEASRTTGVLGCSSREGAMGAAKRLFEMGARDMVVIHSSEGAFAWSRNGSFEAQGRVDLPAKLVVGTVGAGDAFAAGFLYAYVSDQGLKAMLRLGHCAAASSVMAAGCSDGVLTVTECIRLGERYGFRPFGI